MVDNRVIIGNHASNVVIQQGCNNCTQNIYSQVSDDYSKITDLFKQIVEISRSEVFNTQLGHYSQPAKIVINQIEQDINEKKPLPLVKERLMSLRNIVENATGSLIASGILGLLGEITK